MMVGLLALALWGVDGRLRSKPTVAAANPSMFSTGESLSSCLCAPTPGRAHPLPPLVGDSSSKRE